jgi:hypothetical protein
MCSCIGTQLEYYKVMKLIGQSTTGRVWNSTFEAPAFDYVNQDKTTHEVLTHSHVEPLAVGTDTV